MLFKINSPPLTTALTRSGTDSSGVIYSSLSTGSISGTTLPPDGTGYETQ
jgi:hypothetical protein